MLVASLETSKLFSELSAAELDFMRAAAQEKRFAAGEVIFNEGDPGDGIYVIQSGEVEISALVPGGQQHTFSRLPAGDFFGEMAVLDRQPRSASARAVTETLVYFMPCEAMVALLTRSPKLCLSLLQGISRRIREFNQQFVRELLQAERMALIGRFASSIVHDLKNPLTIIGIGAEIACLDSSTPGERRKAQQRINRQIERVTGMVNEILEFTRGSGEQTALAPMDYAAFVGSVMEDLQRDVARKAVTIRFESRPPALRLNINPRRMAQVFYNLVLNAVDEMPEGGLIKLRFHAGSGEVTTEVADSGKGIAPEISATLFEPFATYGKSKGTGLGLSICQRIVEEHGGRIWADNEVGGGAVFRFTLPTLKETLA